MFRRFGSQVTLVQRGQQLLPQEDIDVAEEVTKILEEDGLEVLLETSGAIDVRLGLSDGMSTEVLGGIKENEEVITGTEAGRQPAAGGGPRLRLF